MLSLLVLAATASAQVALPYGGLYGAGLGYGYGAGLGYGYPYAVAKPVVTEVEVPVPVVQYAVHQTGCSNSFGHQVPCLQEGEARRKRAADDEAAAAAPAAVLPYPLAYGGLGYGYGGLGYGYGLGHLGYAHVAAPVEVEVPVTQYKYVPEVQTVELPPACQNHFGFAVPCA